MWCLFGDSQFTVFTMTSRVGGDRGRCNIAGRISRSRTCWSSMKDVCSSVDGQPALVVRAVQSNQHNHVSVQIRFGPNGRTGYFTVRSGAVRRTVWTISVGPIKSRGGKLLEVKTGSDKITISTLILDESYCHVMSHILPFSTRLFIFST